MAEVPLAPERPLARASSSTSLSVRWEAPPNQGRPPITGYDLEYRPEGNTGFTRVSVGAGVVERTVDGLQADTGYEVRVRARNSDGDGPYSPIASATTTVSTPTVAKISILSDPGYWDRYTEDEAPGLIEVGVRFSEDVEVDTTDGVPLISLALGPGSRASGTRRRRLLRPRLARARARLPVPGEVRTTRTTTASGSRRTA